eukprot:5126931-Amphidinium_carterae.2
MNAGVGGWTIGSTHQPGFLDDFNEKAEQHFNAPNFHSYLKYENYVKDHIKATEDDEEDDFDEYDTSHHSRTTTRATESIMRKPMKSRGN